jgi:hypothetical protein
MRLLDLASVKLRSIGCRLRVDIGRRFDLEPFDTIARFVADKTDVDTTERRQTALHQAFYENDGPLVHKWRHYLSIYDHHFSHFRCCNDQLRLLEIGVSHGGSLHLWRQYFGPDAVLFGIDIDARCAKLNGRSGEVRIGSQADREFLRSVVGEMGGVDVVIDDGSHISSHQRISFETLFPLLNTPGMYICEDLHTAYWRGKYEGGFRRRSTFIEFAKDMVDDIHADFHRRRHSSLTNAHRLVGGIHFYNSMVVLEKRPQNPPRHIEVGIGSLS